VGREHHGLDEVQKLGAHVRKGEHGSLVVYANSITKTETILR
jgi:antirestriction protein ArdC